MTDDRTALAERLRCHGRGCASLVGHPEDGFTDEGLTALAADLLAAASLLSCPQGTATALLKRGLDLWDGNDGASLPSHEWCDEVEAYLRVLAECPQGTATDRETAERIVSAWWADYDDEQDTAAQDASLIGAIASALADRTEACAAVVDRRLAQLRANTDPRTLSHDEIIAMLARDSDLADCAAEIRAIGERQD